MMSKRLYALAEKLARQNYDVIVEVDSLSNGQQVFLGIIPELQGCMTQVDSMKDMNDMLLDAKTVYIYSLLKDKLPVPKTDNNVIRWSIPFEAMKS